MRTVCGLREAAQVLATVRLVSVEAVGCTPASGTGAALSVILGLLLLTATVLGPLVADRVRFHMSSDALVQYVGGEAFAPVVAGQEYGRYSLFWLIKYLDLGLVIPLAIITGLLQRSPSPGTDAAAVTMLGFLTFLLAALLFTALEMLRRGTPGAFWVLVVGVVAQPGRAPLPNLGHARHLAASGRLSAPPRRSGARKPASSNSTCLLWAAPAAPTSTLERRGCG